MTQWYSYGHRVVFRSSRYRFGRAVVFKSHSPSIYQSPCDYPTVADALQAAERSAERAHTMFFDAIKHHTIEIFGDADDATPVLRRRIPG